MDLLARVETMPVGARTRFLSAYAREHASEEGFAALLADLAGHSAFAAELSLFAARVSQHRGHVASLLGHEDPDVASAAVKTAAALGGLDDAIEAAVLDGARHVRRAAYKALRVRGRESLADRLLPQVRERFGDREAARLLTACGDATVAEALPELAYAVTAWATLARRHPRVFAEYAEHGLDELPPSHRAQWWAHHHRGIASAVESEPAAWLSLFERFWCATLTPVVSPLLPRLISADPDAAWRFALAPERESLTRTVGHHRGVLRRLADRDTATIAAFLRASPAVMLAQNLLMPRLAPSRRKAVLDACAENRRGRAARGQVWHLPKPLRHKTVRKRLSWRAIADDRALREDLRSYLPFAEVRDELVAAAERSSASERATAYEHLIRCAGLDGPEAVASMLRALDRLARDQDPVHVAALAALAKVPAHHWREAHLAALGDLTGAVLGSPWRSRTTNQAMLRLASRLLLVGMDHGRPAFAGFGYEWLERVAAESGSRDVADALRALPRPTAMELCRRLAPIMSGQAEVGRFKLALVFAEALGRRAGGLPELCALLREAAGSADTDTAKRAASALAAADREAAAELIEADPAMAAVPAVFGRLVRDRVDVLAAWLAAPGDGVSALLRPIGRSFTRRWPPAVREAYVDSLASLARDGRRSSRERAMAVRAMSRVAGLEVGELEGFLGGGDPASSTSALAALDAARPFERAWELLAEHAAGPDAFVAGVGLARLSRRMRPEFLAERLAPMLESEQLAARKQGVRLMLEHRVPGADETVRRMWDDETLPDGVREAITAGLVHRFDRPWAGRIVKGSLEFGADVATPALAPAPFAVAPRHREEYADLIADAVESGDERLLEATMNGVGRWAPYSARVKEALIALASNLDATANWGGGMFALRNLAVDSGDWEPLMEAVRRLRSDERVEPNATAERDLPVRQRLERLIGLLIPRYRHTALDFVPDALIDLLPVDLGTRLLFVTVPWDADGVRLRELTARIADPLEAYELGRQLQPRLHAARGVDLLPFFERLASSGVPNACVLAAAAIRGPGSMAGWTPEWRELLRRLREYPASEVSRLARGVYTSSE
ncbi:hypothetical protein [Glycomyces tenuis]|uniref:hypothetical protein n=4 Tax=Glycomyces tenuis TaxID=58116 RepID=UPI00047C54C6|nr:hypothetical protein [Glycomyces tenuis]